MDKNLIETLGKVIIATAWADKKMAPEEVNSLKDLLIQFQQELMPFGTIVRTDDSGLNSQESAIFEMYIESPVDAAERERLVHDLRNAIWTKEDKELVLSALKKMVEADGTVTEDEKAVLNEITENIDNLHTGLFSHLGQLMPGALKRRSQAVRNLPNREQYFDEFLKNKVYFEVRRRLDLGEAHIEIPDQELRKLSLIGGLMGRVAQIDNVVIETETDKIKSVLQTSGGLSQEAATFVVEVAMAEDSANFDYLRMSREFVEITAPGERVNTLDALVAVANADGKISNDERQEVYRIADYLLIREDHVDAAFAKVTT